MNTLQTTTLVLLFGLSLTHDGYKQKEGIYQLLDREIDEAARRSGHMILMYYVPWCLHYHTFYPEFLEASKIMAESDFPIKFAMFNSHDNEEMTVKHEVFGSPALKYFKGGDASKYDGDRTAVALVKWLHKKGDLYAIRILHTEHLEWLKKESEVLVAYFGKPGDRFEAYKIAAKNFSSTDVTFVYSHSEEFVDGPDKLVIYKVFDEPTVELRSDLSHSGMLSFIETHRFPIVMPFDFEHGVDRVFVNEAPAIIYFAEETNTKEFAEFRAAAEFARGHIVFAHSTVKKAMGERLADYVQINKKKLPAVWIIHQTGGELLRHQLKGPITNSTILAFAHHFLEGKLDRELRSEEIPLKQEGKVIQIVGKNYNDVVKRPGVHVMAMIYAPWCVHSIPLLPIWEQVATAIAPEANVQFVKIDGTKNEIPGMKLSAYPTLLYYSAKNKTETVSFSKERSFQGVKEFLKEVLAEEWDDNFFF